MQLLILSIAPVFIILFYVYYRDKYEKEPYKLLFKAVLTGFVIVLPVLFIEKFLLSFIHAFENAKYGRAFYSAFIVEGLSEEIFKFAAVYFLIWKHKEYNEKFDGIVYAVFVSLGFALIENFLYVFGNENGTQIAITGALTAVPAHAIFGILMGYHIGLAKFFPFIKGYKRHIFDAIWVPAVFHGIYSFILIVNKPFILAFFFPFVILMFHISNKKMNAHSNNSIYKYFNENPDIFD